MNRLLEPILAGLTWSIDRVTRFAVFAAALWVVRRLGAFGGGGVPLSVATTTDLAAAMFAPLLVALAFWAVLFDKSK